MQGPWRSEPEGWVGKFAFEDSRNAELKGPRGLRSGGDSNSGGGDARGVPAHRSRTGGGATARVRSASSSAEQRSGRLGTRITDDSGQPAGRQRRADDAAGRSAAGPGVGTALARAAQSVGL